MLREVFYWLFNMSVAGALSGAVVLLLRLVKRIPRRVIAVLWAIPFFRMWVPVGIGGKFGLMALLSRFTTKTVIVYESKLLPDFTLTNSICAADSYFPITYKVDLVGDVFSVASVIWVIVASALFLTFAILYFVSMREIRGSERLYDNVYVSDKVTSPSVYGVFRPRIVIPSSLRESEDLPFILLHEKRHIRRLDNLWRILAFLSAALHWFNPFSWIFLKCFFSDLEIACDEAVLQKCDEEEKKKYALALISSASQKTVFVSAFGGAKIKTRVERIVSYRKMTVLSAIAFSALIAALAYFLLTNASV
ncbi:MAG: M56 family metallopeptidase [Clostridia bacterium]|nr:M56 family metallopeptidase [Clostridia bacterium]